MARWSRWPTKSRKRTAVRPSTRWRTERTSPSHRFVEVKGPRAAAFQKAARFVTTSLLSLPFQRAATTSKGRRQKAEGKNVLLPYPLALATSWSGARECKLSPPTYNRSIGVSAFCLLPFFYPSARVTNTIPTATPMPPIARLTVMGSPRSQMPNAMPHRGWAKPKTAT
jgi:hypothetical protein